MADPGAPDLASRDWVCIVTVAGYEAALARLLASLDAHAPRVPRVVATQGCPAAGVEAVADGYRVRLTCNLFEYGAWVALHELFGRGALPVGARALVLHDTCEVGPAFAARLAALPVADATFASADGQCNICAVNAAGARAGHAAYAGLTTVPKRTAIAWEWDHADPRSPKSFPVGKAYCAGRAVREGESGVYSPDVPRVTLFFPSLDLRKHYFDVAPGGAEHAGRP